MADVTDEMAPEAQVVGDEGRGSLPAIGIDVERMPARVWVGVPVDLMFVVSCEQACALSGGVLSLYDADGMTAASAPVDDDGLVAGSAGAGIARIPVRLDMPTEPGSYTWRVVFQPAEPAEPAEAAEPTGAVDAEGSGGSSASGEPGASAEPGASTGPAAPHPDAPDDPVACEADADRPCVPAPVTCELVLSPEAHETSVAVWDVPSPVLAGSEARICAGATCPAGCDLSACAIVLEDEAGTEVARGTTVQRGGARGDLWFAELAVAIPAETGLHTWHARFVERPAEEEEAEGAAEAGVSAHVCGSRSFSFVAVDREPSCLVEVQVCDRMSGEPLRGARVTAREDGCPPYRGVTDEAGACEICVPAGTYRVSAARDGYQNEKIEGVEVGPEGASVTIEMAYSLEI